MIWVEGTADGGSAVWGCTTCQRGAWCWDHTSAALEARTHARAHGPTATVSVVSRHHGPHRDQARDERIHKLRNRGLSIRIIAAAVGLSTAGVIKALKRVREPA